MLINSAQTTAVVNQSFLKRYLRTFHWDQILNHLSEKIITLILLSLFFWILKRFGHFLIQKSFSRYQKRLRKRNSEKRLQTLQTLAFNIFQYGLGFFWIYSILSTIGIPVGTLIASAGIFSLAIGLGAQGFVSDIVSGFFILFEKQIDVGEYVIINHIEGTVTAVGLRTTQITSFDGTLNFIPNRNITTIANLSRNHMVANVQIRINPNTPIQKSLAIIQKVNQQQVPNETEIIGSPDVKGVITLTDGSPALQVYITTKNGAQWQIQKDFLGYYLEALTKAGIKLPKSPLSTPVINNQ